MEFVVMYCEHPNRLARLHAFERGGGSMRDENHVADIVRAFCKGNEGTIVQRPPAAGERPLFEIVLAVRDTRGGTSTYHGWSYRRHEPCPYDVANAGMELYAMIKGLLKKARKRRDARRIGT